MCHVENELTVEEAEKSHNISLLIPSKRDESALLPLFQESSSSVAMIMNGLDIIKKFVDYLYRSQLPVISFDQPLYASSKLVQWNWKENYEEKCFAIMMGPLHIEMAALKTIGDWLRDSDATLFEADIASLGPADSFLHAAHVTKTRNININISI